MGRLVRTTYPGRARPTSTATTRRAGGRAARTAADGRRATSTTAWAGSRRRPTRTRRFTENTYDAAGRLVATKDARGKTTTLRVRLGRPANRGRRSPEPPDRPSRTTRTATRRRSRTREGTRPRYEYDALNRRTKTIFPSADGIAPPTETTTGYDELGRRTSETDQAGKTTQLRVRRARPADRGRRRARPADELRLRRARQPPLARPTPTATPPGSCTTSSAGRRPACFPDGKREAMTYDAAGQPRDPHRLHGPDDDATPTTTTTASPRRSYPEPGRERQLHLHGDRPPGDRHRRPRHDDATATTCATG